ncbi:MAG: phosphatase [Planctomycetota bacterium]|nr:phosphatase [Planctomycetota bacterium]
MKYSLCFLFISVALFYGALKLELWGIPLFWLAGDFALLSLAYALNKPGLLGKSRGRISLWALIVWAPFLAFNYGVWHLYRLLISENAFDTLDDLVLSRRLFPSEYPSDLTNLVDCTAEFTERRPLDFEVNYISLPILDASVPELDLAWKAIDQLKPGRTLIHCAQGHGRTALFAALLLLKRGWATTVDEALLMLTEARPGIGLNKKQRQWLDRHWRESLNQEAE